MLDDNDPLWEQHSGRDKHQGVEWGDGDGVLAEAFYAALPEGTRFIFDLMMDDPGERLSSDWIAAQMSQRRPRGARAADRRSVATSLGPVGRAHASSGRRFPFYWWRDSGGASLYAMKPTVARLFREAREKTTRVTEPGSGDWSPAEVRATVDDYLAMLAAEIAGRPYSKTEHRRALRPKLQAVRTEAAIEFKHANISAAMLGLGLPYIRGYKPRVNRQGALAPEIQRRLEADPHLLASLRPGPVSSEPPGTHLERTPPPAPLTPGTGPAGTGNRKGRQPDYGLLQEENRQRGTRGEDLVFHYERDWLRQHGRPDLAGRVRWVARDDGDGLGYDVFSFDAEGDQRYIEVKTTALGAETPFYISSAELDFAQRHQEHYALYRVYDVLVEPRFFVLEGNVNLVLDLTATTYRARIATTQPGPARQGEQ
jgi:hypothetical protein